MAPIPQIGTENVGVLQPGLGDEVVALAELSGTMSDE